ncbi:MAG: Tex family protein [Desulfuromonadaceae bacterium]|nr:RNA-binding transcriptional accessory protein [Geobacteraceae bacterium]
MCKDQENYRTCIAKTLNLDSKRVKAVLELLDGGATLPFIARYRKEQTGSMDEEDIAAVRDARSRMEELEKRRASIIASLDERDLYVGGLKQQIDAAVTLKELEDIYLPHRVKRRTRATIAREKGLEALAHIILRGTDDAQGAASRFIRPDAGVNNSTEALAGARDIVAEHINEDAQMRAQMRRLFASRALLISNVVKKKIEEAQKFSDYFTWSEKAAAAPSHRLLAILRGEAEGLLRVSLRPSEEEAVALLQRRFGAGGKNRAQIEAAIADCYKRLLAPSMETELRAELKHGADTEAIRVFRENLRELLMAPPLGQKSILAIDPGFRTGCKVVCLDRQGKLLEHDVIYPFSGAGKAAQAQKTIEARVERFRIEAIGIGNGTGGRETENFIRACNLKSQPLITQVNESGASIYSASAIARQEFPKHDITVRGAVSIGRRLADPLAELVKIEPKSIGVGQYQHDVDQGALKQGLDDTVISCVNRVGVELNSTSAALLSYVSGLGPQLAQNIIDYRDEHGAFRSKAELKKVKRLGPRAFEQAAGFVRISDASDPLDRSAVHPERFDLVKQICTDNHTSVAELVQSAEKRAAIDLKRYCNADTGMPTLKDIMHELAKPGRDPRSAFESFAFAAGVEAIGDLKPGMSLPGIVTNVTNFGAFIDIGVHQDGLAHISELADGFVKDPAAVVKVGQKVRARVISIDEERKRIALSLKKGG